MCDREALANTTPSLISPASATIFLRSAAMMMGGSVPNPSCARNRSTKFRVSPSGLPWRDAHAHVAGAMRDADAQTEASAGNLVHERGTLREVADRAGIDRCDSGAERDASACSRPAPRTATCCRTSMGRRCRRSRAARCRARVRWSGGGGRERQQEREREAALRSPHAGLVAHANRDSRCRTDARAYSSTVPRSTGTQLPATVALTGPSAVLRAVATIRLGRPISTPCSMS